MYTVVSKLASWSPCVHGQYCHTDHIEAEAKSKLPVWHIWVLSDLAACKQKVSKVHAALPS